MKYTILLPLLFAAVTSFAQVQPRSDNNFGLVINGKTFKNGAAVPKQDLKQLARMEVIDLKTKKQYKPTDFEWIISLKGNIWKNQATIAENWNRLAGLLEKMDDKSVLFIDNMAFNAPGVQFPKTFNFKAL